MISHTWGDEWFEANEKELYNSINWISKFYFRKVGKRIIMKEKYGTIRYQYTDLWIIKPEDALILFEIIHRACRKFHRVAPEICDDVITLINPITRLTAWYKGYFEGICWGAAKSRWASFNKKFYNPLR